MSFVRLLWLALVLPVLAACSTLDKINPFSDKPDDGIARLTEFKATAQLESLWRDHVGDSGSFVFSPAVAGGSVFAAAEDGRLLRFDDGRQVWQIDAGQPISGGVGVNQQLLVVGTLKGEVLAFHIADGTPAWQARVSTEVLAAPLLSEQLVVVRSGDTSVTALNVSDGKQKWIYQRSTPTLSLRSAAGVTLNQSMIYAGFPGGKLVAIDLNSGAARWEVTVALPRGTTELERMADVIGEPLFVAGSICAIAYQGQMACFDADTGRRQWSKAFSSAVGLVSDGSQLYAVDDDSVVHAFDRSGTPLWRNEQLRRRQLTRPLAIAGHVVVADFEGVVHLLAAGDGAFAARFSSDGSAITAAPRRLGGRSDVFLVQTRDGTLQALKIQ